MTLEGVLLMLLVIVLLFAAGWFAHWVITTFFPEPIRTPALLFVGVVLLIVIVYLVVSVSGLGGRKFGRVSQLPAMTQSMR